MHGCVEAFSGFRRCEVIELDVQSDDAQLTNDGNFEGVYIGFDGDKEMTNSNKDNRDI